MYFYVFPPNTGETILPRNVPIAPGQFPGSEFALDIIEQGMRTRASDLFLAEEIPPIALEKEEMGRP